MSVHCSRHIQYLNGCASTFLVASIQGVRFNLHVINVFQMWTLLEHVYFLNKQRIKYVCMFLDETLKPHVKIASSSRSVVLNQIQWFILVTFKSHIPKSEVHELGDSRHTLSLHCGRYIRIMSEDVQVFLNKTDWSDLMELARVSMGRQILKLFRLHEDLIEWRKKVLRI